MHSPAFRSDPARNSFDDNHSVTLLNCIPVEAFGPFDHYNEIVVLDLHHHSLAPFIHVVENIPKQTKLFVVLCI